MAEKKELIDMTATEIVEFAKSEYDLELRKTIGKEKLIITINEFVAEGEKPKVAQKTDEELNKEALEASKKLVSGTKIDYTPNRVYEFMCPNGLQLYYNSIIINLLFDGRTYKFTQPVINYIEKKINKLAAQEAAKKKQFQNPIFGKIE